MNKEFYAYKLPTQFYTTAKSYYNEDNYVYFKKGLLFKKDKIQNNLT